MSDKKMRIVIASDHFGRSLKDPLFEYIHSKEYDIVDMGVNSDEPVLYPNIALQLAEEVAAGNYDRGILVCGTGAGMSIVANKVRGVRAVCIHDPYSAERAVASNNAQVATLGSQVVALPVAKKLIDIWLESEFQGGRSLPKVELMIKIDEER